MNFEQKFIIGWLITIFIAGFLMRFAEHIIAKYRWKRKHKKIVEAIKKEKENRIRFGCLAKEIEKID